MGRAAECGQPGCKGALGVTFNKKGEETGYYCQRCSTVFKSIKTDPSDGIPRGAEPTGKIEHQGELEALRAQYDEKVASLQARLDFIAELIDPKDDSDLAKAIRGAVEDEAIGAGT